MRPTRVLLPLLVLLVAGCAGPPVPPAADPPGGTAPTPPTPEAPGTPPATPEPDPTPPTPATPAPLACPELAVAADPPQAPQEARMRLTLRIENCGREDWFLGPVDSCPRIREKVGFVIEGRGQRWYLWSNGHAVEDPQSMSCHTVSIENRTPAGASQTLERLWAGHVLQGCGASDCLPVTRLLPPGAYNLTAYVVGMDGIRLEARTSFEILQPEVPPYDPDAPVKLLVPETVPVNGSVSIQARNEGNRTVRYSQYYAACSMRYYHDNGTRFLIPPGTHCDVANTLELPPNATASLFHWGLDECTRDQWGCVERRPLPPGTYHLRMAFHDARGQLVANAGATLRIVPDG